MRILKKRSSRLRFPAARRRKKYSKIIGDYACKYLSIIQDFGDYGTKV